MVDLSLPTTSIGIFLGHQRNTRRHTKIWGWPEESVRPSKACSVRQTSLGGRMLKSDECQSYRAFKLVSDRMSYQKPPYRTAWETLLRKRLLASKILKLAITKLSCGQEGLKWWITPNTLEIIFQFTGINVLVCCSTLTRVRWIKTRIASSIKCHSVREVCTTISNLVLKKSFSWMKSRRTSGLSSAELDYIWFIEGLFSDINWEYRPTERLFFLKIGLYLRYK